MCADDADFTPTSACADDLKMRAQMIPRPSSSGSGSGGNSSGGSSGGGSS